MSLAQPPFASAAPQANTQITQFSIKNTSFSHSYQFALAGDDSRKSIHRHHLELQFAELLLHRSANKPSKFGLFGS
jgi:hypothetical protein